MLRGEEGGPLYLHPHCRRGKWLCGNKRQEGWGQEPTSPHLQSGACSIMTKPPDQATKDQAKIPRGRQLYMHTDNSPHKEQSSIAWPENPLRFLQTATGITKLRLIQGPLVFVFTSHVFSFQGMGQPCKWANALMGTVPMPHCFAGSALTLGHARGGSCNAHLTCSPGGSSRACGHAKIQLC